MPKGQRGDHRPANYRASDPRFPSRSCEQVFKHLLSQWDNRPEGQEEIYFHSETIAATLDLSKKTVIVALDFIKTQGWATGEFDNSAKLYPLKLSPPEDMAILTRMF